MTTFQNSSCLFNQVSEVCELLCTKPKDSSWLCSEPHPGHELSLAQCAVLQCGSRAGRTRAVSALLIYNSGGNCIIQAYQIKAIAPYKQDLYNSLWVIDPCLHCESCFLFMCACVYALNSLNSCVSACAAMCLQKYLLNA